MLNISGNNSSIIKEIIVEDVLGRTLLTNLLNKSEATISLEILSSFIYFLKIKGNDAEQIFKVIKK